LNLKIVEILFHPPLTVLKNSLHIKYAKYLADCQIFDAKKPDGKALDEGGKSLNI